MLLAQVSSAERLAERAQEELYKACQRAEKCQADASKQQDTLKALQVILPIEDAASLK